jgi:hypothetical protein
MKKTKPIKYIIPLFLILLLSCERDDICTSGTSTTPRLLVEFFDIAEQDVLKSVPRLSVYAEGNNPDNTDTNFVVNNVNANTLALPLIIGNEGEEIITRFVLERDSNLRLDGNNTTSSNIDILEISYIPEFIFVSRACGFKSVFNELRVTIIQDGDNWALLSDFPNNLTDNINVEDETATHLNIFH